MPDPPQPLQPPEPPTPPMPSGAVRVPGMPKAWQFYLTYLLLFMVLPLLPLLFELVNGHKVTEQAITLTAAMYAISIGLSTRNIALFGLTLLITILFIYVFGEIMRSEREQIRLRGICIARQKTGDATPVVGITDDDAVPNSRWWAFGCIVVVSLIYGVERYNRHVVDGQPVLDFLTR